MPASFLEVIVKALVSRLRSVARNGLPCVVAAINKFDAHARHTEEPDLRPSFDNVWSYFLCAPTTILGITKYSILKHKQICIHFMATDLKT